MQEQKYDELERRSVPAEVMDAIAKHQAHARVHDVIEQMKAEGSAHELSAEEEAMLLSFRRFKLRMRKQGEVFTWQTRKPDGIEVVQETANVLHPQEASVVTEV
jgi:hypothetical protein